MSAFVRAFAALILVMGTASTPLFAHDEFRFVGSVVKMDSTKNIVSVKYKEFGGKEETVDVKILAKTKITRDSKAVPKAQLRVGVNVVVDALGCEDDYEALAIKIVPPPGK